MDHPSKIRKKKKRKTRHKSSKFSEHELKMRSLRGSELSKESNTPMATDTEEVIYHTSFRHKNDTIEKKIKSRWLFWIHQLIPTANQVLCE